MHPPVLGFRTGPGDCVFPKFSCAADHGACADPKRCGKHQDEPAPSLFRPCRRQFHRHAERIHRRDTDPACGHDVADLYRPHLRDRRRGAVSWRGYPDPAPCRHRRRLYRRAYHPPAGIRRHLDRRDPGFGERAVDCFRKPHRQEDDRDRDRILNRVLDGDDAGADRLRADAFCLGMADSRSLDLSVGNGAVGNSGACPFHPRLRHGRDHQPATVGVRQASICARPCPSP